MSLEEFQDKCEKYSNLSMQRKVKYFRQELTASFGYPNHHLYPLRECYAFGTEKWYGGIEEKVLEEIRNLASKYKLKKVILFGSRARGDYKRVSDIDIAVSGGDVNGCIIAIDE